MQIFIQIKCSNLQFARQMKAHSCPISKLCLSEKVRDLAKVCPLCILQQSHLKMIDGTILTLLEEKWRSYVRFKYFKRFFLFTMYYCAFTLALWLRPTRIYVGITSHNGTEVSAKQAPMWIDVFVCQMSVSCQNSALLVVYSCKLHKDFILL